MHYASPGAPTSAWTHGGTASKVLAHGTTHLIEMATSKTTLQLIQSMPNLAMKEHSPTLATVSGPFRQISILLLGILTTTN